jgi:hypothetical protein
MTGATLCIRDLSEQVEKSLRRSRKYLASNVKPLSTFSPLRAPTSALSNAGDKHRPWCTVHVSSSAAFGCLTDSTRLMSLTWTSKDTVQQESNLPFGQAPSKSCLLIYPVCASVASEHVPLVCHKLQDSDRRPETSFTTLVDIENNTVAACTFCNTTTPIALPTLYTPELHILCGLHLAHHTPSRA